MSGFDPRTAHARAVSGIDPSGATGRHARIASRSATRRPSGNDIWLDRAWQDRDSSMAEGFRTYPGRRSLHFDPRWKAVLKKMNLPVE